MNNNNSKTAEGSRASGQALNLPPKATRVCVDRDYGLVVGWDFQTGKAIREGKWVFVGAAIVR